ncbi:hypothetical protein K2X30_12775 [bacterium]|nr:hypothetical protein [bacterium]
MTRCTWGFSILCLILSTSTLADDEECFESFAHVVHPFHSPLASNHLAEETWASGQHGGTVIYLRRKNKTEAGWFQIHRTSRLTAWEDFNEFTDIKGDIRWCAKVLPPKVKTFFSVRVLDRRLRPTDIENAYFVTVPDGEEAVRGLAALEKAVQKKDPNFKIAKMYLQEGKANPKEYVRRMAEDVSFPIAPKRGLYEHDLNYHFLSVVAMPKPFREGIQVRADLVQKFYEYVTKVAATRPQARDVLRHMDRATFSRVTDQFDRAGNLAPMLADPTNPYAGADLLGEVFGSSKSPLEFLKGALTHGKMDGSLAKEIQHLLDQFQPGLPSQLSQADLPANWYTDPKALLKDAQETLKKIEDALPNSLAER